jgi:hypothetical protein
LADRNNSLLELRDLFNPEAPAEGTVIGVQASGSTASVATARGVVAGTISAGLVVVAGDLVRLEGSTIVGKVKAAAGLPVFNL